LPATAIVYQHPCYIEIVAGAADGEVQYNFLAVVTKVMVNIFYLQYFLNINFHVLIQEKKNYADSTT